MNGSSDEIPSYSKRHELEKVGVFEPTIRQLRRPKAAKTREPETVRSSPGAGASREDFDVVPPENVVRLAQINAICGKSTRQRWTFSSRFPNAHWKPLGGRREPSVFYRAALVIGVRSSPRPMATYGFF